MLPGATKLYDSLEPAKADRNVLNFCLIRTSRLAQATKKGAHVPYGQGILDEGILLSHEGTMYWIGLKGSLRVCQVAVEYGRG